MKRENGRGLQYSAGTGVVSINRVASVGPAPYGIWAVRPAGTKEKAPREAGQVYRDSIEATSQPGVLGDVSPPVAS